MSNPFIIMSAPNGARRQKSDHPQIPITPDDMAHCGEQILAAGASILHLHVRDADNRHSLDIDRYRASISAIRNVIGKDLIIQATTEAVGIYTRHQQMQMVRELKPEATSLALRELCPEERDVAEFSQFIKWLKDEKIFPQYILYNEADYLRFEEYRKKGLFHDDKPFALFVFGSYQGQNPEVNAATNRLKAKSLDTATPWAVCGFADNEKYCVSHAAENNGHIRVGFENNIWRNHETLLENNAEMITYAAEIAAESARPVATVDDIRNMFNMRG